MSRPSRLWTAWIGLVLLINVGSVVFSMTTQHFALAAINGVWAVVYSIWLGHRLSLHDRWKEAQAWRSIGSRSTRTD